MSTKEIDPDRYYVFYDGECGFCNYWVKWILLHDQRDQFYFSALQSDFGQNFLLERELENKQFNTLYIWKPNEYYLIKSQAVIQIGKILGGKFSLLGALNIFPRFVSDKVYDLVAKNRSKLSGDTCTIPTEKDRKKFID